MKASPNNATVAVYIGFIGDTLFEFHVDEYGKTIAQHAITEADVTDPAHYATALHRKPTAFNQVLIWVCPGWIWFGVGDGPAWIYRPDEAERMRASGLEMTKAGVWARETPHES